MEKIVLSAIAAVSLITNSLTACNQTYDQNQIRAVHLSYQLPNVNWDSTVSENKQEFDVYYYKDLIMYNFYYTFDSTVNGKILIHEKRNFYFIYQKDSTYGNIYYPIELNIVVKEERLKVDSLLKVQTLENLKFDILQNWQPDSIKNDTEGNMIKFYSSGPLNGYPEYYNLLFYYSNKMVGIPETFSKKMDNVENKKLYKIQIFSSGGSHEDIKFAFPKTVITWEMNELKKFNKEIILGYFSKYQNP